MAKTIIADTVCTYCGDTDSLEVDEDAYKRFADGEKVQVCFPEMSCEDRERLITGICPKCWDRMVEIAEKDDDEAYLHCCIH